jgi:hypothetical protein
MSKRVKRPTGYVQFRVNGTFLSQLNTYYERNMHHFDGASRARQHLFDRGIKEVNSKAILVQKTLAAKDDFLDPRQLSVSLIVDKASQVVLDSVADTFMIGNRFDMTPAVLKIGYDCTP